MSTARKYYLPLLLQICIAAPAAAGGSQQLQSFVSQTRTLDVPFTQTVHDPNGKVTQEASGVFRMQKPGKFNWRYEKPYEQLIIGDGTRLWIYDKDLDQVTVKDLQSAIGNTPALLLSGGVDLNANFSVTELPERDQLAWVELLPRDTDAGFAKLRLGFSGGTVKTMELLDNFDQTTVLRFQPGKINATLDPENFRFTPPPGVDVIEDL